jgi:hypothetical protein
MEKKLGWSDHTKAKDKSFLLVLYKFYLIIFKINVFSFRINIYSLKPLNFGF